MPGLALAAPAVPSLLGIGARGGLDILHASVPAGWSAAGFQETAMPSPIRSSTPAVNLPATDQPGPAGQEAASAPSAAAPARATPEGLPARTSPASMAGSAPRPRFLLPNAPHQLAQRPTGDLQRVENLGTVGRADGLVAAMARARAAEGSPAKSPRAAARIALYVQQLLQNARLSQNEVLVAERYLARTTKATRQQLGEVGTIVAALMLARKYTSDGASPATKQWAAWVPVYSDIRPPVSHDELVRNERLLLADLGHELGVGDVGLDPAAFAGVRSGS